ncbi:MAG TPA: hypothetical protein VHM89_11660 [Acidimicrobiales bacterium]|nr:hypothetical protein [Acidimicrobiales bacterium]
MRPYHRCIANPLLHSPDPAVRRDAARSAGRLARRAIERQARNWPPYSPGTVNAWLLLVTTKPPTWRDPLVLWPEDPPTLGEPHHGFFYPDPLGFWAEVRRWTTVLVRLRRPEWTTSDALAVTTLLHVGDDHERLAWARELMRPQVLLFLDEPSWQVSGIAVRKQPHYVPDPHRAQQVYEGFWAVTDGGPVVGKSPQHPATHKLYRTEDMRRFLAAAPIG